MNEDDLITQSESNMAGKKKLLSLLKISGMLQSGLVMDSELTETLTDMQQSLEKEIEIDTRRNPPPAPPKPFNIASWIDDDPEAEEAEKPAHTACQHNLQRLSALHTCPYKEDVKGDRESLCTCCASCTNECRNDI